MSKHFSDLGKDSKDLISQDFLSEGTIKFTAQSKTPSNLTVKVTTSRTVKKGKEFISSVVEPKLEVKSHNLELNGKLATTNEFSVGASVKDLIVKGSKLDYTHSQSEGNGASANISAAYKSDLASTKLGLTSSLPGEKREKPLKVNGELVLQYPNNVFWGASVNADIKSDSSSYKADSVLGYTEGSWQGTLRGSTTSKPGTIFWGASFYHKISDTFKWALDIDVDQAYSRGPILAVSEEYKVDRNHTLKARSTLRYTEGSKQPDLRLALSLKKNYNPYITVTAGSDLNVRNILGAEGVGDPHSFGLEVKLQD